MSHVQTKLKIVVFSTVAAISVASCGNNDKRRAEALYATAETAAENGDYVQSIALIDSIDSLYSKEISVRRKAMHLRSLALEKQTLDQISANEREGVQLKLQQDSLQQLISKVDNPIEPYYIAKGSKSIVGNTGIEARMSPDGIFYLISSLKSPKVNHTRVSVSNGTSSATTSDIPFDGERNDRSLGYEVIHYMMPECDSVGRYISINYSEPLTISYEGGRSSHTIKLPPEQAASIATLYRAAVNVRNVRLNVLERQRLEKQLQISRSQAARTFSSSENE